MLPLIPLLMLLKLITQAAPLTMMARTTIRLQILLGPPIMTRIMLQITGVMTLHMIINAVHRRGRYRANEDEMRSTANVERLSAVAKRK